MELDFKKMLLSDLKDVHRAELECFPEDAWSKNMLRESIANPRCNCLVARVEGKLGAYLISYDLIFEGHLLNIAVLPEFRRKGYGAALLRYWMETGIAKKWENAYLEVRESNLNAIKLYQKFNFAVEGLRKKYYSNGEDAVLMVYKF